MRHSQFSRKQRGPHFFKAGINAIEKLHNAGVRYVLNSGDILDRNRQRTCNIRELKIIDDYLVECGMTMYTITGNHDLDSPTWLETLFDRETGPGIVPLDNKVLQIPDTDFTVGGIPGHSARDLLDSLKTRTEPLPDIVLWHGGIDGFMGFDGAYHVGYEELLDACPGVKFVGLGDLHKKLYYQRGAQLIGYPGSTEMCNISEDPRKSVSIVRLTSEGCTPVKDLVLDTTPVYKILFTNQSEADEIVQWKKSIEAEDFCLIHLTYTQEFVDVGRALCAMIDESKTVVRRKRLSVLSGKKDGEFSLENTVRSPSELLPQFVDSSDPMSTYVYKLAERQFDPRVIVEQLIQDHAPKAFKSL